MGWKGILGFEYGIVQAPLGPDISGPELVAAVANAGGIGFLRAPDWVCDSFFNRFVIYIYLKVRFWRTIIRDLKWDSMNVWFNEIRGVELIISDVSRNSSWVNS